MKTVDLSKWKRKEYYDFFSQCDEPFFGLSSEVDCSYAYQQTKDKNLSFFASYLHKALVAINTIDEFKYRLNNKDVVLYPELHASATMARNDGSFGFSFIPFTSDLAAFSQDVQKEINAVQNSEGLRLNENTARQDTIHFSALPFAVITGISHARCFKTDLVPKVTFGKIFEREGKKMMSVSVHIHHGFADAYHVGLFLERFQNLLNGKQA